MRRNATTQGRGARALVLGAALLCATGILGDSTEAAAQTRSLQEGPSVRRQLLFRSARFEVAPAVGTSFGTSYQRSVLIGAAARYHLTNSFSAGLNLAAAPVQLDTSIASNLADADPQRAREMQYSAPSILTDLHISYVPFHGKLNLLGNSQMHFDFYLTVGVGGAMLSSDADDLAGLRFGPAFGVGLRTFINDAMAINLRLSDYLYSSAEAQRVVRGADGRPQAQAVEETFGNHWAGTVGVSFFFPKVVRVSR